ncbi:MAG: hypothetical protein B7Z37_26465 [Verrucomicrobia bacterium 12-59-8]|nr:MAG: hypothetical protein B7Z37_26465 [Verrucomicrobia bacterium 12-59-8]
MDGWRNFHMAAVADTPWRVVASCMILILKTLLHLIQPLSLIWLLLGLWLLSRVIKQRSLGLLAPGAAWLLLTLMTCTPLPSYLLAGLENQVPKVKLAELPHADAILCLGGGAEPGLVEPMGIQLKSAADRLATALTLAAADKAPLLILGGGGFPHDGRLYSEADAVGDYLRTHLSLKADIHSLGVCSDTHDEAVKVAALMQQRGLKQLLLVTSASHMPRSLAVFRKAGINPIPVPCNYTSSLNRVGEQRWLHLPHVQGFESFNGWLHEIVGHWVYLWRGWV